jgi:hypothetical protein
MKKLGLIVGVAKCESAFFMELQKTLASPLSTSKREALHALFPGRRRKGAVGT